MEVSDLGSIPDCCSASTTIAWLMLAPFLAFKSKYNWW